VNATGKKMTGQEYRFSLEEGEVVLSIPAGLSMTSVNFLNEHFALVIRGLARRVPRPETLAESMAALREAGGKAWDKIADVEEYLDRKPGP
jgi:hypothetical protein